MKSAHDKAREKAGMVKITEGQLPYNKYDIHKKMHSLQIITKSKQGADVIIAGIFILLFLD